MLTYVHDVYYYISILFWVIPFNIYTPVDDIFRGVVKNVYVFRGVMKILKSSERLHENFKQGISEG